MPTLSTNLAEFVKSSDYDDAIDNLGIASLLSVKWIKPTNTTAEIQALADACQTSGERLIAAPGTYTITATVTINCNCDLSLATFSANGAAVSPVIQTGLTSGAGSVFTQRRQMPLMVNANKNTGSWTGVESSVGIDIGNCTDCQIWCPAVTGFGIGIDVGGYTAGCVHNKIYIGRLANNRVNLRVGPKGVSGWANQNDFYGGQYRFDSGEGTNISGARHIQLVNITDAQNAPPNNNVFYNPSLEGNGPEFHLDMQGSYNLFLNPRFEASPIKFRFYSLEANQTNSNVFVNGYKQSQPEVTFAGEKSSYNKWIGSRANDSFEYDGGGISVVNRTSSSITAPHIQGFQAAENALGKTASSTDWTYRLFANGMAFKRSGDAHPRLLIDGQNGVIKTGNGTVEPT
jgi:hypothetical protein